MRRTNQQTDPFLVVPERFRETFSLLTATLPGLISSRQERALFGEMRSFIRRLPHRLDRPLPEVMLALSPGDRLNIPEEDTETRVRNLADLVVGLDRKSPLGYCLRRSLTRYYFLRRIGLPLTVHFGARIIDGKPDRHFTGHAWLTLNGVPYHEAGENWRGFTVMFSFPKNGPEKITSINNL